MKALKLLMALFSLSFMQSAVADLYLEMSVEGGGDKLIDTNTTDQINAGGGVKFAAGINNWINDDETTGIRLTVGYMFDSIEASNGDADFDTLTFDAMLIKQSGPHVLGFGGTMHMSPEYKDDVDGFAPLKVEFDDAYGVVVQYGYQFVPGIELGAKLTKIEYEANNSEVDADSFGLFISAGF